MKTLFIGLLVIFSSFKTFAQLTKLQTFEYLNTKFAETADLSRHYNADMTYKVSNLKIKIESNNKVNLSYSRKFSSGQSDFLEYIFDPIYITTVLPFANNYNDAMGLIHIKLSAKAGILKQHGSEITYKNLDVIPLPYFASEKINAERLEKAFLHLKKVYIDSRERDPFLN